MGELILNKIINDTVKQPLTLLDVDSLPEGVCARLVGASGFTEITNENGDDIPALAWSTALARPECQDLIDGRKMWVYCEHPESDEPNPLKAIGCVVSIDVDEENGVVNSVIDIFDNEDGRRIAQLIKYGSKLGVSERGRGLYEGGGDFGTVIPDSFYLLGIDVVTCPAYPDAIPQAIAASKNTAILKDLKKMAQEASPELLKIMSSMKLPKDVSSIVSSRTETPGQKRARAALRKVQSAVNSEIEEDEGKRILSTSDPINFTVVAEVEFKLVKDHSGLHLTTVNGEEVIPKAGQLLDSGIMDLEVTATDPNLVHLLPIDLIEDEAAGIIAVNLRRQLAKSRTVVNLAADEEKTISETVALYGIYDEESGYWFDNEQVDLKIDSSVKNWVISSMRDHMSSFERLNAKKSETIRATKAELAELRNSSEREIRTSSRNLQKMTANVRTLTTELAEQKRINSSLRNQSIRSSKQGETRLSEFQHALVECLVMITPGSKASDFRINSSTSAVELLNSRKEILKNRAKINSTPVSIAKDKPIKSSVNPEDEIDSDLLALIGGTGV